MNAMSRLARTAVSLTLWGLVVLLIGAIVGVGATSGQEPNHASLVVVYPDGRVETLCVEFDEETISGAELLRRSGLSVVFAGSGIVTKAVRLNLSTAEASTRYQLISSSLHKFTGRRWNR